MYFINYTTSPLEKRENETEYEYHKRLVFGKLRDKTLVDYDYSELAPYVYDKDYSTDVARRMMYGSFKTIEKLEQDIEDGITDDKVLSKIEAEKIALQCERQRFFDQRREFNKIVTKLGREEYLYDRLTKAADTLSESVGYLFDDHDYVNKMPAGDNEAVLVLCDWHYGMTANNVFNTYNTEICKQRVNNVINNAIDRLILHKCRKLYVIILGDLLHGCIHTSARVASEELTCDQLIQVSEMVAQCILELKGYVDEIEVHCTYGNHARAVPNKKDSIHRDNFERIIPWWLTQRIAAEENRIGRKIDISIAPDTESEFLFFSPCGIDMCASHGDLDSVKSSPQMLTTLFYKTYGKNIQHILLADKHHSESFEELGVTAQIVGSLCGSDEYSNSKRLYSLPSQLLLIVNPAVGVDAEYKLRAN